MTSKARVINPPRQQGLLDPGGIEKDAAVAGAAAAIENLRQKLSVVLAEAVSRLEETSHHGQVNETVTGDLQKIARLIYNLAGTYGNTELQFVAANLLDSMEAMRTRGVSCTAPVKVHARAARLFVADNKVSPAGTGAVLEHLKDLTGHLQLQRPCSPENCKRCPAAGKADHVPPASGEPDA